MKTTSWAFAAVLLLAVVQHQLAVVPARADDDVSSCYDVLSGLSPCLGFLQGDADSPSGECCDGARALFAAADTAAARQATCECLKAAYSQVEGEHSAAAAQALPADCGLSLPYTISPDMDCSQIE